MVLVLAPGAQALAADSNSDYLLRSPACLPSFLKTHSVSMQAWLCYSQRDSRAVRESALTAES